MTPGAHLGARSIPGERRLRFPAGGEWELPGWLGPGGSGLVRTSAPARPGGCRGGLPAPRVSAGGAPVFPAAVTRSFRSVSTGALIACGVGRLWRRRRGSQLQGSRGLELGGGASAITVRETLTQVGGGKLARGFRLLVCFCVHRPESGKLGMRTVPVPLTKCGACHFLSSFLCLVI